MLTFQQLHLYIAPNGRDSTPWCWPVAPLLVAPEQVNIYSGAVLLYGRLVLWQVTFKCTRRLHAIYFNDVQVDF